MGSIHTICTNGFNVSFPNNFRVRKYNNSLNYSTHNVIRYHTKNPFIYVYAMMRSKETVTVHITSTEIVAQNDRLTFPKYMHFNLDTPIDKIVCQMLTKPNSLVVLDEDSNIDESTLF